MAVGKNISWKKGKWKQYDLPCIIEVLGRISSRENDDNFGEENQDLKYWGWRRI